MPLMLSIFMFSSVLSHGTLRNDVNIVFSIQLTPLL